MHLAAKNLGVKENRRLRVDRIVLDGKKSKTNAVHGNPVADVAIPTARQCVGYSGAAVGGRVSRELRFDDCYIRGRHIGEGSFAKVFIGTEKLTQLEYAVKHIYDRSTMEWNGRDALIDEIGNLEKLREAPNIVQLYECFFPSAKECYIVLEFVPGKALFERIIQENTFTEEEARESCRCVLNALDYVHEKRIAHRDIKPDNLLLEHELGIDKVKLTDFGFSKYLETKNGCRTLCGTPGYLAPEILEKWPAYDVKCDMWSFGALLFELLGGYLPFDSHGSNDMKQIFERTLNGEYYFYPERWEGISKAAKDMITKCLTVNQSRRISARLALSHPWMEEGLVLHKTVIHTQSLASTYEDARKGNMEALQGRDEKKGVDRLQELNVDFTAYMNEREGDSIVSAFKTVCRAVEGIANSNIHKHQSQEDSLNGKPFSFFYTIETNLGQGTFGTVYRCRHNETRLAFAVKKVDISNSSVAEAATLKNEERALRSLRGAPFIVQLYDVFAEGKITHIVLEEMKGGDLLQRIVRKEVYTEREARSLCKELFSAVNYCHERHIAHRDIKPANLLLKEDKDDSTIKLADFGFAKTVKRENGLSTFIGTPSFMAPEIFNLRNIPGYDHRCDLWSVGVVVYVLLGGYLPFEGGLKKLSALVLRGEYQFQKDCWEHISSSAKKLIASFLQVEPGSRLTTRQAMSSHWMSIDDAELIGKDLSMTKSMLGDMVSAAKKKVKKAVKAVRARLEACGLLGRSNNIIFCYALVMGVNKLKRLSDLMASDGYAIDTLEKQYAFDTVAESDSGDFKNEVCFKYVYELGELILDGSFEKVHYARDRSSNKEYSVKKILQRDLGPNDFAALNEEISVLREVAEGGRNHVVCLHEVYEVPGATYIVMEPMYGEILVDALIQREKYTEFDAKELARNLLLGVNHCHRKRIAIRNLTLDNLLLPYGSTSHVIITDFEIAKRVLYPNSLRTKCGNQLFVAPEVLEIRPAYDTSCDVWTAGVIVFILLGGYYPFRGKTDYAILKNVRYGNFAFRPRHWNGVSYESKDFLRSMMKVDPEDRATTQEALSNAWIKANDAALSADLIENVTTIRKRLY